MKGAKALFGDEIVDQLSPPEVWGIDAEGELNQIYQRSGHPGLWFAVGGFGWARFFGKHLVSLPLLIFLYVFVTNGVYRVSRSWRKRRA